MNPKQANNNSVDESPVKRVRLPLPDAENITVLTRELPNEPILPWHRFDSPWIQPESENGEAEAQGQAPQAQDTGSDDGRGQTNREADVDPNISTSTSTGIDPRADAGIDTGINADIDAGINTPVNGDVREDASSSGNKCAETDSQLEGGELEGGELADGELADGDQLTIFDSPDASPSNEERTGHQEPTFLNYDPSRDI